MQLTKKHFQFWELVKKCRAAKLITNSEVRRFRAIRNYSTLEYLNNKHYDLADRYITHLQLTSLKSSLLYKRRERAREQKFELIRKGVI